MTETAPVPDSAPDREATYALMEVGGGVIGIDIAHLSEVYPIDALSPLLVAHPALMGAIRLRGHIIPLVDPRAVSGIGPVGDAPGIAAILARGDRVVALAVNAVSGLARLRRDDVQGLASGDTAAPFFVGGFFHGGKLVNVVDPAAIFALGGLPTATRFRRDEGDRGATGEGRAYLTFRAGGATFAAPAVEVHRTLPRQDIERNALTGGDCLGSVTVNGLRIPVLDAPGILGLGAARERPNPEIVVFSFSGDRLIGLAVDVISNIATLRQKDLHAAPALLGGGAGSIGAVAVASDGAQTYVIRVERLREMKGLQAIAEMSAPVAPQATRPGPPASGSAADTAPSDQHDTLEPAPDTGPLDETGIAAETAPETDVLPSPDALFRDRRRYLIFQAGTAHAAPIESIARIIEPPATITPIAHPFPGVLGFFPVDGATTTLVCLSRFLGAGAPRKGQHQRVLLVGSGDRRIGFLVPSVEGIEAATWRALNTAAAPFREQMVSLGRGADLRVLPCLDICRLAVDIAERFHDHNVYA
ncbi:chemotaxis protein CheW [Rhodovulum visakhapatnamense]|uniref:Chemotaxis signal transduction protein n=1 Tax=Rhodovulum visakhapatnamense TaxID=364297 RepID=A0A4R8FSZ5_9RHOB|nr:chemotaxis protein CheW [Rhodovulum visakhapatnamense]TDX25551.1 chemotaxis signal transduction protein [Rhodovulum visakhapatnamense]